jgi:hypothetical protein
VPLHFVTPAGNFSNDVDVDVDVDVDRVEAQAVIIAGLVAYCIAP